MIGQAFRLTKGGSLATFPRLPMAANESPPAPPVSDAAGGRLQKSRLRRWPLRLLILGILLVLGFLFRIPLMRTAARWWIVSEDPAPADAILVLGGGEDYRPFAAAKLWKEGLAPVVLVPNVKPSPTETLRLRPATTDVIIGVLRAEGVPDKAILRIGADVSSTRDEALAAKSWFDNLSTDHPPVTAHRLLVPTDPFASRRTNWLFAKLLPAIDTRVTAAQPHDYSPEVWWESEEGLIAFQNEVIKNCYYHVKY